MEKGERRKEKSSRHESAKARRREGAKARRQAATTFPFVIPNAVRNLVHNGVALKGCLPQADGVVNL